MKRIFALLLVTMLLLCGCVEPLDEQSTESINESIGSSINTSTPETNAGDTEPNVDESDDVSVTDESTESEQSGVGMDNASFDISTVPAYTGSPYCVINGNIPTFSVWELLTESYEFYSELDALGRCGVAIASIGIDIMPTEPRGDIGSVKPTGWQTVKYDFVDGKYLYNRCHLIGFQLAGENANVKNLITGTRYMNVQGMLPFENMIADYVKETENHVAFRVTPIFMGNELLARGVLMEAYSIEDEGDGICFNVFCYNVQPNIVINYSNGDSRESDGDLPTDEEESEDDTYVEDTTEDEYVKTVTYVLNMNTKKFHRLSCSDVKKIKDENYAETDRSREEVINMGYSPCGHCDP